MAVREIDLAARYLAEQGTVLLSGIQALVRLPMDQHRADRRRGLRTATFISGYPGSPLGGLDLALERARQLVREPDVVHRPGLNEDLAASAVWGSQMVDLAPSRRFDGVLGMWYGKSPGLDRSGDVLRHASFMGVGRNGGTLALVGDDPTAKSSTLPSDSQAACYDLRLPVLVPGSIQDVLDLGLHGFALSRYSGCWVALKVVTTIADGFGTVEVAPERVRVVDPGFEHQGRPWQHLRRPGVFAAASLAQERDLASGRLDAALAYAAANELNRLIAPTPDAWLGIVAAGKTCVDVLQTLADLGLDRDELERIGVRVL
jgi:indolepyruvate ferredoxin oxidoreductase